MSGTLDNEIAEAKRLVNDASVVQLLTIVDDSALVLAGEAHVVTWNGNDRMVRLYGLEETDMYGSKAGQWEVIETAGIGSRDPDDARAAAKDLLRAAELEYVPSNAMAFKCLECGDRGMTPLFDREAPPDPDRHGNRRPLMKCPACGERGTHVTNRRGPDFVEGPFERL
jgi:hypothetical protein